MLGIPALAALKTGAFWLKAAPYIISIIAVIGLLYGAYSWAWQRGSDSRDAEVASITRDRDTHAANEKTLQAAFDQQNAAVAALKADSDQRAKDGAKALQRAQKANQSLKDQSANLRRSAALKHAANDPCVASDALASMGKI